MRVWSGKIRAENVLVGRGGVELPSAMGCSRKEHPTTISAITAVLPDFASTLVTEL